MNQMWKRTMLCTMAGAMVVAMAGCGKKDKEAALDPGNPTSVTVWNYYNGDQLAAFETLVEEFNNSVGAEKGIVVESVSQGDVNTLADALLDAVNGKAGAQDCPTLAAVYSETGYILEQKEALAPIDTYFTEEELSAYIPEFLEEGRFNDKNELMIFPVSKSTEVFAVNATDWQTFADATNVTIDSLKTQEDLVAAAQKYYEWTDSLTPDVAEDGKALYGRDSMANYLYIGSYQLGHELFNVKDGKLTVDLDHDTFRTLWDNYYIPYINGYFGAYANFRSEDAKTGKILALTSSSSGISYLPGEVTLEDDSTHPIEMSILKGMPFADAKNQAVVQQGAGYCMLKSTEAEQLGAVEFLKWFTAAERNIDFAVSSGYSPVTLKANTEEAIKEAYGNDAAAGKEKNMLDSLLISSEEFSAHNGYATKAYEGGKDVRSYMEGVMKDKAAADREAVVEAISAGKTREEATAEFSTDEYFDAWFNELTAKVTELTGK